MAHSRRADKWKRWLGRPKGTGDDEQVEHPRSLQQFLFDLVLLLFLAVDEECHQTLEAVVHLLGSTGTRYMKRRDTPVARTVDLTELRDLSVVGTV